MTDATATVIIAAIVGLPPTIAAVVAAMGARAESRRLARKIDQTQEHVEKIETHTNGMVEQIKAMAKTEGKAEQKAETATPSLPIIVQAAPVASGATQEEITKWMAQGYALGKAVREANGVKDKPPEHP